MTAAGPLARKLAEVEAEVRHLAERNADLEDEIANCDLAEMTARAELYAKAIRSMTDDIPNHRHTDTCAARYVACHAAKWLGEREQP